MYVMIVHVGLGSWRPYRDIGPFRTKKEAKNFFLFMVNKGYDPKRIEIRKLQSDTEVWKELRATGEDLP